MSTPLLILAHAADAHAPAGTISRRLYGLGYGVERRLIGAGDGAQSLGDGLGEAQRLILLWSRGAASANLDAPLRRAQAAGKLSLIRLASSPTPARFRLATRSLPRPGASDAAWRALTEGATAPAPIRDEGRKNYRREPGSRLHGLIVLLAMGAVTAWAAYVADTGFAEQVHALLGALTR